MEAFSFFFSFAFFSASMPFLRLELGYDYERGRLLKQFDIEDGLLVPVYESDTNHRVTFDARWFVSLS